jgi:polysaccharide pyruvyl transferase WcaK-like protein
MFGLRSNYRKTIETLVDRLLTSSRGTVLLIPHTFAECEEEACAALLSSIEAVHPGRIFMLNTPLNERELKWLIGRTSFFIGSRMHACIAALSQCVPTVGLAYSDKFFGVFQSAGVRDAVIDLRSSDTAHVVAGTLHAFEQRAGTAERLRELVADIQDSIVRTFGDLLRGRPHGSRSDITELHGTEARRVDNTGA